MKLFECQCCSQPLYFENKHCESCGHLLGFSPDLQNLHAVEWTGEVWTPLADPSRSFRFCANAKHDVCNWLIPAESADWYCAACRHNRVIPNLSEPRNLERWRRLEAAKHRLFYTLLRLELPIASRTHHQGLAFDFLSDPAEGTPHGPTVLTGHDNGLITINIAEADDAERERRRHAMGEPYRTLLGHFRHEIGHYYWDVLVGNDASSLDRFRTIFGDERQDYGAALQVYYAKGPAQDWRERFVSAYASAHPWEDWAETWAHYLHMIDTLETAGAFGLSVRPKISRGPHLSAAIDFDPYHVGDLNRLISAWVPLTFAVNSLNRSMGQPDLYPFVLAPTVIGKLAFVHQRIYEATGRDLGARESDLLKAVAAGLRNAVSRHGL